MRSLIILLILTVAILSQLNCEKNPTGIQPVRKIEKIIYWVGDMKTLLLIDADGSNNTPLVNIQGGAHSFDWFPDCSKIILADTWGQWPDDTTSVKIYDLKNRQITTLLKEGENMPSALAVSPDGFRIAFQVYDKYLTSSQIYLMDSDGSNQRILVDLNKKCYAPLWSPDGLHLFFEVWNGPLAYDIYSIYPEGGEARNLSNSPTNDLYPTISPDSKKIAYASYELDKKTSIIISDIDGSNQRVLYELELKTGGEYILELSWSPDGNHIAFAMKTSENENYMPQIYVINVNSSETHKITSETTGAIRQPQWFAGSDKIIYSSNDNGFNLFRVDLNGENKSQIIFIEAMLAGSVWDYKISPGVIEELTGKFAAHSRIF